MKKQKMWTLLSLLIFLLSAGCTTASGTETEANDPVNNNTAADESATTEATLAPATAVPLPTTAELTRAIRLTPAITPEVEIAPTSEATAVVGEVPEEMMTAVYENLTAAQNILPEDITVTRAEATVWRDGSLGCPRPNASYTQEPVNGYWIVLEVNGRSYDYRAAESGYFTLCQNNQPPAPPIVGTPIS